MLLKSAVWANCISYFNNGIGYNLNIYEVM
jgi:hypothetical protein